MRPYGHLQGHLLRREQPEQQQLTMLAVNTGSFTFEGDNDGPVTLASYRAKTGEENLNILEDTFSLYPRNTVVQVKLTQERISYEKPSALSGDIREVRLDIWDVVGVVCGRQKGRNGILSEINKSSSKTKSDIGAYVCLYAYPYNKPPSEGGVRQKKEIVFRYSQESSYEKNLDVVQKWKTAIDLLLQNIEVNNVSGTAKIKFHGFGTSIDNLCPIWPFCTI